MGHALEITSSNSAAVCGELTFRPLTATPEMVGARASLGAADARLGLLVL